MKKKRITYGVPGMMEFETVIMVGRKPEKLLFSEGSVNSLGNYPARLTTDSLLLQLSIEKSKQFKTGLIKRLKVVELDEEINVGMNPPTLSQPMTDENKNGNKNVSSPVNEAAPEDAIETDAAPEPYSEAEEIEEKGEKEGPLRVEFEINDDAKDYLEKNFGAVKSRLHNREEIIAFGKENGVDIVFV